MSVWRRAFFGLRYLMGRAPWDTGIPPPELVEVVEGASALPPGRALDIGCGTGTSTIYLARQGWRATGIDFTRRAVATARRKAASAGLEVSFLRADVTRLDQSGLTPGFDLLLDVGCFHSLAAGGHAGYARGAAALARPGATFLLYSFRASAASRMGVEESELRAALEPHFEIREVRTGEGSWNPAWFFMRRR